MSTHALNRIRSLVKGYSGRDDKTFVANYRSTITDGVRSGQLTHDQVSALDQLRATLERWYQSDVSGSTDPIEEWAQLVEATIAHLSKDLLDVVVSRVPPTRLKSIDWTSVVLEHRNRELLRVLVKQKVLKTADLMRVAKAEPERFYESTALDILLESGGVPPRTVWGTLETNLERGAGMTGAEAIAEAYSLDSSSDASFWLAELLAHRATVRRAVLLQILRDAVAAERLARYVAAPGLGLKGKRRTDAIDAAVTVIDDLLGLCVEAVSTGKRTAPAAMWVISMTAIGVRAQSSTIPSSTTKVIDEALGRVVHPRLLSSLRHADDRLSHDGGLLVATQAQVYATIQEYLQGLPSGGGEGEPAERAARYQRYLGRKEVIQELLPILRQNGAEQVSRDALDAALFNLGLRPLGVADGKDTFDVQRHEPTTGGILPGDPIRIIQSGWQLGEGERAVILAKAHVVPQE